MGSFRLGRRAAAAVAVLAACLSLPAAAAAQAGVTTSDIQRLENYVFQAGTDISAVPDATIANRLRSELDTLREEVIYLKVKLRREGDVPRKDYMDVRDRIQELRSKAMDAMPGVSATETRPAATPAPVEEPVRQSTNARANEVPVGTEIDVRLQAPLSSDSAQVEDRFQATTVVDLNQGDKVLIPAGSVVRGVVTKVDKAGRLQRTGRLSLNFDQVTVNGRAYPIHATVTEAIESSGIRGEAGRIGAGAGVGAILGGIFGGFKGVLTGILIGGGGTIAATEGKDVELPAGTVLRLRFDSPVTIR
ncbi:MAG: hypothetical protein EHM13_06895 [Acidobacteria bacterium]|nr:MAG: hypothetical protein EHM13_06895 [Acidobacteriota bacterium]